MIIKRKLEGRAKLRVWDEHMHTNRYQIDNEKDLLNTTGNSMGKKPAVSYIRKKNRRIDKCLCTPESNSCTPKTNKTLELEISSIPI